MAQPAPVPERPSDRDETWEEYDRRRAVLVAWRRWLDGVKTLFVGEDHLGLFRDLWVAADGLRRGSSARRGSGGVGI
jgi:hypothetical protein